MASAVCSSFCCCNGTVPAAGNRASCSAGCGCIDPVEASALATVAAAAWEAPTAGRIGTVGTAAAGGGFCGIDAGKVDGGGALQYAPGKFTKEVWSWPVGMVGGPSGDHWNIAAGAVAGH
eukprot:CAMPEP_0172903572 /NCGR_PEP_ID=MMETSP1075-20121228/170879_1 /TAXON_ID=2916 /ORGANISM="Ceratium fusus, Strain PA161109" /LENGTH=119 /DNA_ID=CAMNT_0013760433 /DNA_START=105 /DNA_END=464 /DNA_ORIENTATION=-